MMRLIITLILVSIFNAIGFGQEAFKRTGKDIDPGNPDAQYAKVIFPDKHHHGRSNPTRLDSTYGWTWNTDAANWDIDAREIYAFNGDVNPVSSKADEWEAGAWSDEYIYTYTFDDKDRLTEYTQQYWGGVQWVNTHREAITYDENDNLVEHLIQLGNVNDWRNFYLTLNTYDSLHNITTQINRTWQNIAWVNSVKRENTYDDSNRILQQLRQDWESGAWDNTFLYDYTYDSLSNLVEYYSWKWNNTWEKNFRNVYEYDEHHNRLSLLRLNPAGFGNLWSFDFRYVYTYDEFNNELSSTEQDIVNGQWVNVDQYVYEYDTDQKLISEVYNDWIDSTWTGVDSTFHYYNEFISFVPQHVVTEIGVFPNPTTDILFLDHSELDGRISTALIYSADGRLVQATTMGKNELSQVPVDNLLPGNYHLVMKGNDQTWVARFVKQ